MGERLYTDEDVRWLAETLHAEYDSEFDAAHLSWKDFEGQARKYLDGIVQRFAGRLLPADAETETVYGVFRLHDHHKVLIGEHETREEAEEFAAGVREACAKAVNAADLPPMRLEIRQRTEIATPWVSSENTEEADRA